MHFILYNVQCTLYIVHCTLYSVHCTLYTIQQIPCIFGRYIDNTHLLIYLYVQIHVLQTREEYCLVNITSNTVTCDYCAGRQYIVGAMVCYVNNLDYRTIVMYSY